MADPLVTIGIPTYNRPAFLKNAIESALAQSYGNIKVMVNDNASSPETREVVESFGDVRLEYARNDSNVGMIENFNRIIKRASTRLLMLLPDDDLLYPEYMEHVVAMFERHPSAGVVHSAFDEFDMVANVKKHAVSFVRDLNHPELELGGDFIERSMTSIPVCFPSATFRTAALRQAGGLIASEEPFADLPLFLRIGLAWNFGYLPKPLVCFRDHPSTETSRLAQPEDGSVDGGDRDRTYTQILFDRRMGFLAEAGLPSSNVVGYRALATTRFLIDRGGLGAPWSETTSDFLGVVCAYPRILADQMAWHLIAAHLGGRSVRRGLRRFRSRFRDDQVFSPIPG